MLVSITLQSWENISCNDNNNICNNNNDFYNCNNSKTKTPAATSERTTMTAITATIVEAKAPTATAIPATTAKHHPT